jgi:hypothetical protein
MSMRDHSGELRRISYRCGVDTARIWRTWRRSGSPSLSPRSSEVAAAQFVASASSAQMIMTEGKLSIFADLPSQRCVGEAEQATGTPVMIMICS